MSRFFANVPGSSSESEYSSSSASDNEYKSGKKSSLFGAADYSDTESDSLSDSSDATSVASQVAVKKSRFEFDSDSESDEEGGKQVKSQKEKIQDEFEELADSIEMSIEEDDWLATYEDYEKMIKLLAKSKEAHVPAYVYTLLPTIEDRVAEFADSGDLKGLHSDVARAFNALRQKIRKAITQYTPEIERSRQEMLRESMDEGAKEKVTLEEEKEKEKKVVELSPETLMIKLSEVIKSRTKKGSERNLLIEDLAKMYAMACDDRQRIHVLSTMISVNLDQAVNSSVSTGYIVYGSWKMIVEDLSRLFVLFESQSGDLSEGVQEEEELGLPTLAGIRGTVISFIQRLDDEFVRALQSIEPHSQEYIEYVRGETLLYKVLEKCRRVLIDLEQIEFASLITVRQIEHLYTKNGDLIKKMFDSPISVVSLCNYLYENAVDALKIRALLYHVYWLSLHDQYEKAKLLFSLSKISDATAQLEVSTQILYNRTIVQLGLASFRTGHIKDTYFFLQEICSTGKPKELLAQGISGYRNQERVELDRAEKQRLIPYHMHINVEMIDCAFLTVSMLLEIPFQAALTKNWYKGEKRIYSCKHLRRLLDSHERNIFNGPPEHGRDLVIAASLALIKGDWRDCERIISSVRAWSEDQQILRMLKRKIRESALFSFLINLSHIYTSLSMEELSKQFDMPQISIQQIISKFIEDYGLKRSIKDDFIVQESVEESSGVSEVISTLSRDLKMLSDKTHDLQYNIHQLKQQPSQFQSQGKVAAATETAN